jgi:hypothetical protein
MAGNSSFIRGFMRITARAAKVWGPADRIDSDTPVVHRHDDAELSSEEQLAEIEVERDAEGHAYAFRKRHEPT